MRIQAGRIGLAVCASLSISAATIRAQSSDPCVLFPGNPADLKTTNAPGCIASYWLRVANKSEIGGLYEFGAMVTIVKLPNASAAAQRIAGLRARPGVSLVNYGNGGIEKIELPNAVDLRVPTPEEQAKNQITLSRGGFDALHADRGDYFTAFACGANIIYVYANPSKGPAARQLIGEFEENLKAQSICGNPGSNAVTTTTPVVVPPRTPVAPPRTIDEGNTGGGGTRYFDGQAARDLMTARENGSRYMAVISREYDDARGCFVEERAWVSTVRASSGGRVGAVVGPSISVCVKGAVLDQATINQAEANMQNYRNQLAKALGKRSEFEGYLRDPKFSQWAKGEIAKIDIYINQYEKFISQTQTGIAASIPP